MTQKIVPTDTGLQLTDVPLVYVDTLMGLAIGPFVSKVILGVENSPQHPNATLQISMPTNALNDLANHILEILSKPDAQAAIVKGHKDFQDGLTT